MSGGFDFAAAAGLDSTPTAPTPSTGGGFDFADAAGITPAFVKRDPLTAGSMDEATNILRDNALHGIASLPRPVLNVLGVAGKAIQPFAAPQQLLFGGLKAIEDVGSGNADQAWNDLKRGGRSALSYLTWGGYQAAGLHQGDPRAQSITGYELFKTVGLPNWAARWAGTGADFLLDVPVVGAIGKVAKVDKLTAGLRIGENMAQSFTDPGALRAFMGGVAAAPFTTQPIKRAVEAVPQGLRQAGRENLIDPILNARLTPRDVFTPISPTVGQAVIARNLGLPAPVASALDRKNAVLSQYAVLHNEAVTAGMQAQKGLSMADQKGLSALMGRLADESDIGKRAGIEGQIRALESSTGRVGLYDDAVRAANKAVQFDVFSAEKLHAGGLMTDVQLKAFQQGDKRHLRRVYALYGEDSGNHLRRLLERDGPAQVTFDDAGLHQLYGATLNPTLPPAPPISAFGKSELTRGGVAGYKGQAAIPLLDPAADANRLVTRPVTRDVQVGTYDLGDLDLGNLGRSEVTSLRNILGWDAIQQGADGKWKATGVVDNFPVGHPVVQSIFGDLTDRGVTNIRTENRTFAEQVPNYYDPKAGPESVQAAARDAELNAAQGALYIHSNDLTAFMAGATPQEEAAFMAALDRLPTRERTRTVGRNTVEDSWLPVDPTDPAMKRLVDRARGGGAALFDGTTGQPTLGAPLPGKINATPPSPQEFAQAVQTAYSDASKHPADALKAFFTDRGMSETHIARVLDSIGNDWAKKAGIDWRPSDQEIVRHLTGKLAEGGTEAGVGGRGVKAVTAQRQEVSAWYADALGEVQDFTQRLDAQHKVAGRAATTGTVIKDIRQYLTDNNLIEHVDTADMGAIHKTAGLRVLSEADATKLGNGFNGGDALPAEIHRILLEQVSARPDAPLGLAWQWYSSRWQGIKLANPASIMTNIKSAFVMADHAGQDIPGLLRGMSDYMRLHKAAVRGDGALDTTAQVNGVTMRELFNNGAFTHNTLMNAEVTQQSNRLIGELANAGSTNRLQQGAAALQNWLTETSGGQGVSSAYRTVTTPMRWLGDTYGRTDSVFKGGLYMSLRKQGMAPEKAAKIADETFFNYNNVPYVVDGLRRFGLLGMPFASFKFLATGRFMRSLYTNPYGVEKYYRLPNSSRAALADQQEQDGKNSLSAYDAGSPDYVRQGLYVPLGKDSSGRVRAVKLDDILPETAVFDAFNADGVTGQVPPAVQWVSQIISGKGYQGMPVYRTGGTLSDTMRVSPQEAARGVVQSLWQLGVYPWAPGQPQTERIVRAIADKSIPMEAVTHPVGQQVLKYLTEGPAAAFDPAAFSTEKKGTQAPADIADALARMLGVMKAYPVSTSASVPGSYRNNLTGRDVDLQTIATMEASEMKSAQTEAQRVEIRARYDRMRAPIIARQRNP